MGYFQNIEISNLRVLSKFPFTDNSSLALGKYKFPVNWIESVSIQIQKGIFPLHISNIYIDNKTVVLSVSDKSQQLCCRIKITKIASFVVDNYNRPCGQFRASQQLYDWLYELIKNTVYGFFTLKADALIISPQVIVCTHYTGYTGLSINGNYIGHSVLLNFQRNMETITASETPDVDQQQLTYDDIRFNVYGDYPYTYQKQKKLQKVNGVDLRGKDLIIQHSALSNLRVTTQSGKISLIGVTDVT